jgi:hypothetical protein
MNDGGTRAQVYKIDGRRDITTLYSPVPCQFLSIPRESGEQLWNLVPRQAHGRKGNTLKVPHASHALGTAHAPCKLRVSVGVHAIPAG